MRGQYTPEHRYPCAHCGTPFYRPPSRKHRFCSKACGKAAGAVNWPPCARCGQPFYRPPGRTQHFCSRSCQRIAYRGNRSCAQCGRLIGLANERRNSRYCSAACAAASRPAATSYRRITTPDGREMLEHRYVAEQAIGRALTVAEVVHHRNGNIHDNRPENLQIVSWAEHTRIHKAGVRRVRWSSNDDACRDCGRNDRPHHGYGFCGTCYARRARRGLVAP